MFYLIEYNRASGEIIEICEFEPTEQKRARNARLELELNLNMRGVRNEVVILEADSLEALKRTHRRYFETLTEFATPLSS